jgi:type II secretory pathway component PulC
VVYARFLALCLWLAAVWPAAIAAQESAPGSSELRCDDAGCALGPCLTRSVLTDPMNTLRSVRVVPYVADGATRGFKIYGVRAESLPAKLGLHNGDLVTDLNGQPITTPDTALLVAAELQQATRVEIVLTRGGQRVVRTVSLDRSPDDPGVCAPAPAPPTSPPPPAPRPASARDLARDITCKKLHCTLRGDVVERILTNTVQLTAGTRIVPVLREGKARGFELVLNRPGSVFSLLGLRVHDVVKNINGYDISSPDNALAAYASLRDARELTVDIERGGKPVQLRYSIVP